MVPTQVQRTLVKSPPELWSELSDPSALARHLGELGEIRITRLEPERKVEWTTERASGTVLIDPSGWGTRVTLTASAELAEPAPERPRIVPRSAPVTPAGAPEDAGAVANAPVTSPQEPTGSAPAVGDARSTTQPAVATSRAEPDVPVPATAPEPPGSTRGQFFARVLARLRGRPPAALPDELARPETPRAAERPPRTLADTQGTSEASPSSPAEPRATPAASPITDAPAPRPAEVQTPVPAAGAAPAASPPAPSPPAPSPPAPSPPAPAAPTAASREPSPADATPPTAPNEPDAKPEPEVADVLRAALDSLGAAHHRPFSRS